MFRIIAFILLLSDLSAAQAQCLGGNCVNGNGKYDYGWCVYEGEFKDSKAQGNGSMKYSDYAYVGQFSNGVEDGTGVITYSDGRKENVTYHAGRKAEGPAKIAAADYKPLEGRDANCVSGDCVNGYGTYQFPSGNKYEGNFKDRKREGQGTAYFTGGDKFEGTWHNNEKVRGTYTFISGAVYKGTYNAEGREQDGQVTGNGVEIPYINGVAVIPPPRPKVVYVKSDKQSGPAADQPAYKPLCPDCHGLGQTHETFSGGATAVDKYNNRSTVFGAYSRCSRCRGTGHVE